MLGFDGSTRLQVYLNDGYWTHLLDPSYEYEPDLAWMLNRVVDDGVLFLDCGANIGYWTFRMRARARHVVAVEASHEIYERLRNNATLNPEGVTTIHGAIWSSPGAELNMSTHRFEHAGGSVTPQNYVDVSRGWTSGAVISCTVDDLVARFAPDLSTPVVIKLDVEGAEVPAITGAQKTLRDRNTVLLYEDHGMDRDCKVTRHLLGLGLQIFGDRRHEPLTLAEVLAIKVDPRRGYNFAACSADSPFTQRLLA